MTSLNQDHLHPSPLLLHLVSLLITTPRISLCRSPLCLHYCMYFDFCQKRSSLISPLLFWFQGILGSVTGAEMVIFKKVMKYLKNVKSERRTGSLKKWLVMRLERDGFDASICKSKNTWITTSDCSGCELMFILVSFPRILLHKILIFFPPFMVQVIMST